MRMRACVRTSTRLGAEGLSSLCWELTVLVIEARRACLGHDTDRTPAEGEDRKADPGLMVGAGIVVPVATPSANTESKNPETISKIGSPLTEFECESSPDWVRRTHGLLRGIEALQRRLFIEEGVAMFP